jgi:hypothetical protein
MQRWLVSLRRNDKTVLMVHHTGKPKNKNGRGDQRGTSKREDILSASIMLSKRPEEWGRFAVTFTKSRGFRPPDELAVTIEHAAGLCRLKREEETVVDLIAAGLGAGKTQKDIAKELGVSEAKVSRIVNGSIRPKQGAEDAAADDAQPESEAV